MKKITINQIKPNPSGKDRFGHLTPNLQLTAEWVDFKNTGDEEYRLDGLKLQHIAYTMAYPNGVWDTIMTFNGILKPNEVIRVHSGSKIPTSSLRIEDSIGANYHLFTEGNYVWNNNKSDSPRIIMESSVGTIEVDKATYDFYPPEGKILKRVREKLI